MFFKQQQFSVTWEDFWRFSNEYQKDLGKIQLTAGVVEAGYGFTVKNKKKSIQSSLDWSTFLYPWHTIFISRVQPKKGERHPALIKQNKKSWKFLLIRGERHAHGGGKQNETQRILSWSWSL